MQRIGNNVSISQWRPKQASDHCSWSHGGPNKLLVIVSWSHGGPNKLLVIEVGAMAAQTSFGGSQDLPFNVLVALAAPGGQGY